MGAEFNIYHAVVDVGDPSGLHRRVSLEAQTLNEAKELFAARYGSENVNKVWEDIWSEKRRGYSI